MTNFRTKITQGYDFNFFDRQVITSADFGDVDGYANVLIPIRTNYLVLSLINEGANTIEYSFNGNTLHGDLVPSTPSAALTFNGRNAFKIWFRVPSGASTVRIEAYAKH